MFEGLPGGADIFLGCVLPFQAGHVVTHLTVVVMHTAQGSTNTLQVSLT